MQPKPQARARKGVELMDCECWYHRYHVAHLCHTCRKVVDHSQGSWDQHRGHDLENFNPHLFSDQDLDAGYEAMFAKLRSHARIVQIPADGSQAIPIAGGGPHAA